MFSTMTYTFVIASLFGSVCLTKPVIETALVPTVEQVYKVGAYPETEYYQPVYVDTVNQPQTGQPEKTSFYAKLLNES